MENEELIDELQMIRMEMLEKLSEAENIVNEAPDIVQKRAEAYWIPQIRMALENDHEYLGGSGYSMEDTILELKDEKE